MHTAAQRVRILVGLAAVLSCSLVWTARAVGQKRVARIINGVPAEQDEFPSVGIVGSDEFGRWDGPDRSGCV